MGNFDTELADNARLRSLLQPHFSPRRMRPLRPRVEELTAGLLSDLAEHGPPADLHQALALAGAENLVHVMRPGDIR
jgi:pentalenolactone synthase